METNKTKTTVGVLLFLIFILVSSALFITYKRSNEDAGEEHVATTTPAVPSTVNEQTTNETLSPTASSPQPSTPTAQQPLTQPVQTPKPPTENTPSDLPAFAAEDMTRGWYWGDVDQKKPGTPSTWQHRDTGTRNAQWYDPSRSENQ